MLPASLDDSLELLLPDDAEHYTSTSSEKRLSFKLNFKEHTSGQGTIFDKKYVWQYCYTVFIVYTSSLLQT